MYSIDFYSGEMNLKMVTVAGSNFQYIPYANETLGLFIIHDADNNKQNYKQINPSDVFKEESFSILDEWEASYAGYRAPRYMEEVS